MKLSKEDREWLEQFNKAVEEDSKLTSEELDEKYKQLGCYPKTKP